MSNTGLDSFDDTVNQTNLILKDIERKFGWEGRRDQAYGALRAVLQTLRDRLTVEEAADFSAQLPMLVRGFFFEGWRPSTVPRKMDNEEFYQEVRSKFSLDIKQSNQELVKGVLGSLFKHVETAGEMEDVKLMLPKELQSIIEV